MRVQICKKNIYIRLNAKRHFKYIEYFSSRFKITEKRGRENNKVEEIGKKKLKLVRDGGNYYN